MLGARKLTRQVVLTAAAVVLAIPFVVPNAWLPAEKLAHDLVLAEAMLVALLVIIGGWLLFGSSETNADGADNEEADQ